MAKWNFRLSGNSLVKEIDVALNDSNYRAQSFMQPSMDLGKDYIVFKESGQYKTAISFNKIGTINLVNPTNLKDAYDKLLVLISTI